MLSRSVVSDSLQSHGLQPTRLLWDSVHWDFPGRSGSPRPPSGDLFPTQGSNPGLLHCRWILYHLSPQESPRILEWVAYAFSSGSSQPRNQTRVSCIAGRFLPAELPRKPRMPYTKQIESELPCLEQEVRMEGPVK